MYFTFSPATLTFLSEAMRHEAAVREVKNLGGALARHTGQEESVAVSHLFQRLSNAPDEG